MTPSRRARPPITSPARSANAPKAARRGAADPPGMWTVAGATGWTRAGARRVGPAVANRRSVSPSQARTSSSRPIGMSAISPPQSGTMIGVRKSSRGWMFMPGSAGSVAGAGRQDVGHDPDGPAEGEEHRHTGPLDVITEDRREGVVDQRDHDRRDADQQDVPGVTGHRSGLRYRR